MKMMKSYCSTILVVCALVLASCGSNDPHTVAVTGVTLDKPTAALNPGMTVTLAADVAPADAADKTVTWSTSDNAVATVVDGTVTAVAVGAATITVTTRDGGFEDHCAVTVAAAHPVFGAISFRSATTKTVGEQTWSDVVMATRCKKNDFNGGYWRGLDTYEFPVDCRQDPGYGDLFSWEAVNQYQDDLCPGDWRVPTKDDFIALDLSLGGSGERDQENPVLLNKYVNTWGAEFGGHAVNNQLLYPGMFGNYWSQSVYSTPEYGDSRGYALVVDSGGWVNVFPDFFKYHGFNVRCVK